MNCLKISRILLEPPRRAFNIAPEPDVIKSGRVEGNETDRVAVLVERFFWALVTALTLPLVVLSYAYHGYAYEKGTEKVKGVLLASRVKLFLEES